MSSTPTDPDASAPLDLDLLMTLDPCGPTGTGLPDQDINMIVQYHRNIRAAREAGQGRKAGPAATKPKAITELLNAKKPPTGGFSRRGF